MYPVFGPVFAFEWLTSTRRWQLYGLRALFVAVILIGMIFVWINILHRYTGPAQSVSLQTLARYGESLYETVVSIELTLVLLAAPAATAGAICLDKSRGTLDHMLATDLSNSEIVFGKFGVRLMPVLSLIACALPLTALTSLLGGIDPLALFGSFTTAIACASLACSLGLTLSVWGRKTHEVLMGTYLILILWLISPVLSLLITDAFGLPSLTIAAPAIWGWIECSNPYYLAFAPYTDPGKVGPIIYSGFLVSCLCLSALFLGLATLRIRRVVLIEAGHPITRKQRWSCRHFPTLSQRSLFPGPSLDGNPIFWREWRRSRPSRLSRLVWSVYNALGILWIVLSFKIILAGQSNPEIIPIMTMCQVALGLLLLSVSAPTSLAEERVRGSLDVVLCTPLSTRSIVAGKWWGSFLQAIPVLVWPAILAGILLAQSGQWFSYLLLLGLVASYCAVITSLGLALATWVSHLGRAVALTVSVCITFSIGWVVLIVLLEMSAPTNDQFLVPMVMGSPLYGTIFATFALTPGDLHLPNGVNVVVLAFGAIFWIVVYSAVAWLLFASTLATFDRCLGRVAEVIARPIPLHRKKATKIDPDLDEWIAERLSQSLR